MKPEGHRARAEEIERSVRTLISLDAEAHVATIVEGAYGAVQQYIAYGMQRHVGHHVDGHVGLIRALNAAGITDMAVLVDQAEKLRAGHWYGGQGNGTSAREALQILDEVKQWSLA
jgi:hypothetical protein